MWPDTFERLQQIYHEIVRIWNAGRHTRGIRSRKSFCLGTEAYNLPEKIKKG